MRYLLPLLAACSGGDSPTDATSPSYTDVTTTQGGGGDVPPGACGEVTTWSVTLLGSVEGADGSPAAGAAVWVEDRGWEPGTVLAEGVADAEGVFQLDLAEVTSVEDCWATLLDYVLVGEQPGERGETDLNSELFNAIDGGTFVADLGTFPLRLEPTGTTP